MVRKARGVTAALRTHPLSLATARGGAPRAATASMLIGPCRPARRTDTNWRQTYALLP
jgi:hypothetical protein